MNGGILLPGMAVDQPCDSFLAYARDQRFSFEVRLGGYDKHWAAEQQHADLLRGDRVSRKGHDSRYNCFGLCFAGGVGWVGVEEDTTIPLLTVLTRPPEPVKRFDARALLVANGWDPILKDNLSSVALSTDRIAKVLPGDIALYGQPGGLPLHAGIVVSASTIDAPYLKILSKLRGEGEWIHGYGDPMVHVQCGTEFEVWGDRRG